MIIHLCKDLMLSSNANAVARQTGADYKMVGSLERAVEYCTDPDKGVSMIMIDLQTPGFELTEFVDELSKLESRVKVIAYAQHVMVDLLNAATESPIDHVMTRGQFHHQIAEIMASESSAS